MLFQKNQYFCHVITPNTFLQMEPLALAPDLSVLLEWSSPMHDAWLAKYPDLLFVSPSTEEQRHELDQWDRRLAIAYRHIQRFYNVTGTIPVAGDLLQVLDDGLGIKYTNLCIKSRAILTSPIDEKVRIIYQVQGEYTERLESCSVEPAYWTSSATADEPEW
jgi:hypothetical protein